MGVQKNATYKVDNGTDFDEYNFKTMASQVKTAGGSNLDSELSSIYGNQSLSLYGYKKLPGGVILQWGSFDVSMQGANEYAIDGAFPITFPSVAASKFGNVRISGIGAAGTAYAGEINVKIVHKSTQQFTAIVNSKNGSLPQTSAVIEWVAIGW